MREPRVASGVPVDGPGGIVSRHPNASVALSASGSLAASERQADRLSQALRLLPWTWWAALQAKWVAGGRLTRPERRGFAFWVPVGLVFGAVELGGALSGAVRNSIP